MGFNSGFKGLSTGGFVWANERQKAYQGHYCMSLVTGMNCGPCWGMCFHRSCVQVFQTSI